MGQQAEAQEETLLVTSGKPDNKRSTADSGRAPSKIFEPLVFAKEGELHLLASPYCFVYMKFAAVLTCQ